MACKRNTFFDDKKSIVERYNHIILGSMVLIIIIIGIMLIFKHQTCD